MLAVLEWLIRTITTTEALWQVFFALLLVAGLYLLGRGLGSAFKYEGSPPTLQLNNELLKSRSRVVLSLIVPSLIGLGLFVPGLIGLYRLTSMTTLEVLTSLSEEEYTQFQGLEEMFHKKYKGEKLRIRSENVNWSDLIRRLKQQQIDVIIFDVTRRLELLREDLLKPLDDHRLLIPSSIYPTLLDNVNFDKHPGSFSFPI
jgi:hypothetical protein